VGYFAHFDDESRDSRGIVGATARLVFARAKLTVGSRRVPQFERNTATSSPLGPGANTMQGDEHNFGLMDLGIE